MSPCVTGASWLSAAFRHGQIGHTIDCRGLVVAPGFIDLHTHSDKGIVTAATRGNVMLPSPRLHHDPHGQLRLGPIHVKTYLDEVDAAGAGTNVLHLLPHGELAAPCSAKPAALQRPTNWLACKS